LVKPDELRAYALRDLPPETTMHDFIDIPKVLDIIARRLACESNPAVRRRRAAEAELLRTLAPARSYL